MIDEARRQFAFKLMEDAGTPVGHETFIYTGKSMNPILNDGDRLIIKKASPRSLSFGDIIVYQYKDDYIIHRFMGRLPGGHILAKGDNALRLDTPVSVERLVGKALTMEHHGKRSDLASRRSRRTAIRIAIFSGLEAVTLGLMASLLTRGLGGLRRVGAGIKRRLMR